MKLRGLLEFMFLLIVTSCAEGSWTVIVNNDITAERGSNVTINCTFTCPSANCNDSDVFQVYWKKNFGRGPSKEVRDNLAYVYHENDTQVQAEYKGKTELLKNKGNRDCSLKIKNVTDDDSRLYVRVIAESAKYSFYNKEVAIRVFDVNNTKTEDPSKNFPPIYMAAICVSVAVLVIIIFILGIFCFIKNKRTKAITREESGYYANFSRASSNDAKSELSCKKIDTLPELKDIEEPVYANMKYPLDQSMDQTNNVYGNVDYSR